ncbi:hypothetical protein BaRGS_00007456 [Batillaria attramentaria]|uniref:Uncharacterized protein n=1 Tax=Batillaria attramentaria TaxID=370345 RepID=A0ABD0LQ89_9CAEN
MESICITPSTTVDADGCSMYATTQDATRPRNRQTITEYLTVSRPPSGCFISILLLWDRTANISAGDAVYVVKVAVLHLRRVGEAATVAVQMTLLPLSYAALVTRSLIQYRCLCIQGTLQPFCGSSEVRIWDPTVAESTLNQIHLVFFH